MGVFKVLMWKHYTVRKRRLFQTLIEFFSPVSIVLVLFLLKPSMMKKAGMKGLRSGMDRTQIHRFSLDSTNNLPRVLFIPDNSVTKQLMREVNITFYKPLVTKGQYQAKKSWAKLNRGVNSNVRNVTLPRTSKELLKYDAIVEFKNMDTGIIPKKLNYVIKIKPSWVQSPVPILRTNEKLDDFHIQLLKLQWAIDSAFLKLKYEIGNEKFPNWEVMFEELPKHPTRRKDTDPARLNYVNSVFLLLPYVSFLGPLLPFIFLMIRLLEERSTGIQELVKMVGVTPTMLGISQFLNSLPSCLIFSFGASALLKSTAKEMVPGTIIDVLFIGFFLHFISMIAMAFACSYIVREAQYTVSLAMFVYIGMWIPIRTFEQDGKNDIVLFFLGLLPHCPTYWYMNEIHTVEVYYPGTEGISYENWNDHFNEWDTGGKNGTVRFSFMMQLIQIFYFFTLSWYLERVRPGKYGIALPWNFPFTRDYWNIKNPVSEKFDKTPVDPAYEKYFEDPPQNMEPGIKISHVTKIFGSGPKEFVALKNVNLEIYKGEITVLLGHNGAGKTTLISIITGMYRPTSGKIYVKGMDTVTQQVEVRQHLGLCPQHNLFFPDLTVMEHLLFFTMIKGGTFYEAKKGADSLLEQLALSDKAHSKTSELSGGMLRRLQLGCALCGNASVLILDEPTSGLDVEARRELWDMLLALRGDRTLLLTTHFMEEADVLGDRLAALHAGKLRCHATPMFLKRAVGSGFRLSITTLGPPDEAVITQAIQETAPQATLKEKSVNTLIYDIPTGTNMPAVFNSIEGRKQELNIESLGVGITTLEEVFIELCCDVEDELKMEDTTDRAPVVYHYITGRRLFLRQAASLFKRQFDFTMSKLIGFILLQIVMPFVMCVTITVLFNNAKTAPQAKRLSLDLYPEIYKPRPMMALYRIKNNGSYSYYNNTMDIVKLAYPAFEFRSLDEFPNKSCPCEDGSNHSEFLIGVDINGTQAKVLYQPDEHLSAPVGLNFLSNVLAAEMIQEGDGRTINMQLTDSFKLDRRATPSFHIPKQKMNCALFATFNIFIIMATAINDVSLPCRERISVARHTHVMAGCSPALYWAVTFIWNMCCYELFCVSAAVIAAATRDTDKTISDADSLTAYTIALTLSGMDFYAFAYFISYYFNDRGASMLLIGFTIVFGFLSPILMMGLADLRQSGEPDPLFNRIMNKIGILLPAHMFTDAVSKMTDTARFNSFCKYNFKFCSVLPYYSEGFDKKLCCSEGSETHGPFSHYALNDYAMGRSLIIIVLQFFLFATLVLLLEYKYFNRWWNSFNRKRVVTYPPLRFHDKKVAEEKGYVGTRIVLSRDEIHKNDAALMYGGYKTYFKLFGTPTFALRDINFSLKQGECFGLIGSNGAGKTTTFKLLSYEEAATQGTVFVDKHFVTDNSAQYMRGLGYCPQFFGLDEFRTGQANLRMLLELRGFSKEDVIKETTIWLEIVAMAKYGHRAVNGYSGGMVRRLATAAALCCGAPLTLLDEPTAGVDTAARRLVWTALRRGLRDNRSVLLTSNNMDEVELLCQRVMILHSGEMCVLGTPSALKSEFAPGNAVVVKMRAAVVQGENGTATVAALKNFIESKFNCILKDEHLVTKDFEAPKHPRSVYLLLSLIALNTCSMSIVSSEVMVFDQAYWTTLYYRIIEQLSYKDIFTRMEELETNFNTLVEDYSVSDTTLEDVFLSLSS